MYLLFMAQPAIPNFRNWRNSKTNVFNLSKELNLTPIPALRTGTGIVPLHFHWKYLIDRFPTCTPVQLHLSFHKDIRNIFLQWIFTHSCLPLVCERVGIIFRLEPFSSPTFPIYRQAYSSSNKYFENLHFTCFQIYETEPFPLPLLNI